MLHWEPIIRLAAFIGVFGIVVIWEARWPKRMRAFERLRRWPGNLGLAGVNTLLLRVLFPSAAVGFAILVDHRGWGLLPILGLPKALRLVLGVIALDLVIYGQHVVFHASAPLWRLHRVHHADMDFDVTTGLRFHPLEILLSMVVKLGAIVLLGVPATAVLAFEVLLNAGAMFTHANAGLPERVDRIVRAAFVTPDMHRVHHSVLAAETNRNFGFNLSCWDRLFGTYLSRPAAGHSGMIIGLPLFREAGELQLGRMLLHPFRTGPSALPPESHGAAA